MEIDLDVVLLLFSTERFSKIPILDWMEFHQLYSSLRQFYHQDLECKLIQTSIRFYENEVFGEIQRLSY